MVECQHRSGRTVCCNTAEYDVFSGERRVGAYCERHAVLVWNKAEGACMEKVEEPVWENE